MAKQLLNGKTMGNGMREQMKDPIYIGSSREEEELLLKKKYRILLTEDGARNTAMTNPLCTNEERQYLHDMNKKQLIDFLIILRRRKEGMNEERNQSTAPGIRLCDIY